MDVEVGIMVGLVVAVGPIVAVEVGPVVEVVIGGAMGCEFPHCVHALSEPSALHVCTPWLPSVQAQSDVWPTSQPVGPPPSSEELHAPAVTPNASTTPKRKNRMIVILASRR